jgi:hypothetical protein
MADTVLQNAIALAGITDCAIKVGAATAVDVYYTKGITINPIVKMVQGEGEGQVFLVHAKMGGAELEFNHSVMDVTLWTALTGNAATGESGTTPNVVETTDFTGLVTFPYFVFQGQTTSVTGVMASGTVPADAIFKLWKCKVTGISGIVMNDGDIMTVSFKAIALPDPANSSKIFSIIKHETFTALAWS